MKAIAKMRQSNLSLASKIDCSVRTTGGMACVGLDPDRDMMPPGIGIAEFNRKIVDATAAIAAAYKLQLAFYEAEGAAGIEDMEATILYIRKVAPHAVLIGDAKRCDVGHTASAYAKALFDTWGFDAATVVSYTGKDGLVPFLERDGHGIFVVCRTSNPSAPDLQDLCVGTETAGPLDGGQMRLYEAVAALTAKLNSEGNAGIVVGSTYPKEMIALRKAYPDMPFLIPGVGNQQGDISAAVKAATGKNGFRGLINASRSIIYASSNRDEFEDAARKACLKLQQITSVHGVIVPDDSVSG